MAIQRWNPLSNLRRMEEEMFKMFPRNLGSTVSRLENGGSLPTMDAFYTDDSLVLEAAVPGFKADNVDLGIRDNWLVLKGRKESDDKQFVMKESAFDTFHRAMRLPNGLKPEAAEASFEDGILTITIPKSEETKTRAHKIAIKS